MTMTGQAEPVGAAGRAGDGAGGGGGRVASASGDERVATELARLTAAIDDFVEVVAGGEAGDAGLVEQIALARGAADRLGAAQALLVDRLDRSGLWRGEGARTLSQYLAWTLGILPSSATAMVKLGRVLSQDLPAMGLAALAGEVGMDHARLAMQATTLTETRRELLRREIDVDIEVPVERAEGGRENPGQGDAGQDEAGQGEAGPWDSGRGEAGSGGAEWWGVPGQGVALVPQVRRATVQMRGEEYVAMVAGQLRARDFRIVMGRWVAANDPAGLDETYRAAEEREHVLLARTLGGWHLEGFLSPRTGELLAKALESVHTPPAGEDQRSAAQRRAGDLATVADRFLAADLGSQVGGSQAQIAVTVSYETLKQLTEAHGPTGIDLDALVGAEPAEWAEGTGPLPYTLLAQLMCDSTIARYVFGPKNEIINYGREHRFFNRAQRRALAQRDRGCVFPGCSAQASWTDAHHVPDFDQDGASDIDKGALLCPFHHRYYHAHLLTMRQDPHGRWRFRRRDGTELADPW